MAALLDLRMPAVITQEVPTLPPSIAVVPSAVPVFIGYTEKAEKNGEDITLKATRIRNMREFEAWFGVAPAESIEVDVNDLTALGEGFVVTVLPVSEFKFRMHYALRLYYANGGGPCFIMSVGLTKANGNPNTISKDDFIKGVKACEKAKDITILLMPDAIALDATQYGDVITEALRHCQKMINRVTVIDVADTYGEDIGLIDANFRSGMPTDINLKKYGAAYYPYLSTSLGYNYIERNDETTPDDDVSKASVRFHLKNGKATTDAKVAYDALVVKKKEIKDFKQKLDVATGIRDEVQKLIAADPATSIASLKKAAKTATKKVTGKDILPTPIETAFANAGATEQSDITDAAKKLFEDEEKAFDDKDKEVTKAQEDFDKAKKDLKEKNQAADFATDFSFASTDELFEANNLIYSKVKEAIDRYPVVMPPSPAIAGLYVATDFSQGPWRAPANFSLAGVIRPTVEIDDDLHANLNVDSNAGKSINAIRSYVGKGVLVFGARTLAGNDLEWRYVNVRRTFCFIEDSVARAMQDFVFAPNIRDTWIKVKAMIGNFLNGIWQAGGLFGNTPDEAYQVSVGLPETMSDVDILEGRMIVEIKLRVSRPAEFIILRYEHKFQVSNN